MEGAYLLELLLIGPFMRLRSKGLVGRGARALGPCVAFLCSILLCPTFLFFFLILLSILFFLSPHLPQSPLRDRQASGPM